MSPRAREATAAYVDLAKRFDIDPSTMALAFVNSRTFVTSTIIGATTMDQLKVNVDSADVTLPAEVLREIENLYIEFQSAAP